MRDFTWLIKERGMTQVEFAKRINIEKSTLNNYLKGRREPELDLICRMCDELGVSVDYLLGRSAIPSPELTDEEWQLLAAYRKASLKDRRIVEAALDEYMEAEKREDAE